MPLCAEGASFLTFAERQEYGHEVLPLGLAEKVTEGVGELTQGGGQADNGFGHDSTP